MLSVNFKKTLPNLCLDIAFEIPKYSYSFILGPSGAGKSLTLKIIAGLIKSKNASIKWDGKEIGKLPPEKRQIVYLPQNLALFPHKTVYENIIYTFKSRHLSINKDLVEKVIEEFQISRFLNRYPQNLSGGEKQRAALARAIVAQPRVLLLDEPLSSLDFHLKMHLIEFLELLKKDFHITVIHVTHDPLEAIKLAEKLFILEKGKIVFQGHINELFQAEITGFGQRILEVLKRLKISLNGI